MHNFPSHSNFTLSLSGGVANITAANSTSISGSDGLPAKVTLDLAAIGRSIDQFKTAVPDSTIELAEIEEGAAKQRQADDVETPEATSLPTVSEIDAAQRQQLKQKVAMLEQVGAVYNRSDMSTFLCVHNRIIEVILTFKCHR